MAPGLIKSGTSIAYTGTGRSNRYFFYRGRKANLHGVLMVGSSIAMKAIGLRFKKWYKDHQLYIWYWITFFAWIFSGFIFACFVYGLKRFL